MVEKRAHLDVSGQVHRHKLFEEIRTVAPPPPTFFKRSIK